MNNDKNYIIPDFDSSMDSYDSMMSRYEMKVYEDVNAALSGISLGYTATQVLGEPVIEHGLGGYEAFIHLGDGLVILTTERDHGGPPDIKWTCLDREIGIDEVAWIVLLALNGKPIENRYLLDLQ